MKELDQFTADRLRAFIDNPLENGFTRYEQMALAYVALAAKTAEPIVVELPAAYMGCHGDAIGPSDFDDANEMHAIAKTEKWTPLYLSPAARVNYPEIPDGWVSCNERLPDTHGNYWGWWSESKRQGTVWFIKSDLQAQFQSSEITHWIPLPPPPKQEE